MKSPLNRRDFLQATIATTTTVEGSQQFVLRVIIEPGSSRRLDAQPGTVRHSSASPPRFP